MPALFESGAFGKNTPAWHREGNVVDGTFDFDAIFPADGPGIAGINWGVRKRPAFVQLESGAFVPMPGSFGAVRVGDDSVLTRNGRALGKGYDLIPNRDSFAFLRDSMEDRTLQWETAISVDGGATVAGIVSLPDSGIDLVKGDRHYLYLAVVNSHDGSGSMRVFPTDVRVVCANTVAAALNSRDRALTVNVRHSGSTSSKLSQSREILRSATAEYQRFLQWQGRLSEVSASARQVDEVSAALFGTQPDTASQAAKTRTDNKVLALKSAIRDDMLLLPQYATGSSATAYNVFNGITAVVDHTFGIAGGESRDRFEYAMMPQGSGSKLKNAGIEIVSQVFGVPLAA